MSIAVLTRQCRTSRGGMQELDSAVWMNDMPVDFIIRNGRAMILNLLGVLTSGKLLRCIPNDRCV